MKNKNIRLIALVSALVMSTATFTACGSESHEHTDPLYNGKSWDEVVALCQQAYTERAAAVSEQERLRAELGAYTNNSDGNKAAISVATDGTNRMTFNSNDSKIIFPSSFEFPGSTKAPSNGSISIVENVQIAPGTNWIQKSSGATLDLEHTNGISGTIKIGKLSTITGYYNFNTLKADIMEPWAAGLPLSTGVSYSEITDSATNSIGCAASTPTLIDSENAVLKFGMLSVQDLTVTYVFVYRGTQDVSKDESITNLLNSINIYGSSIIVDQY